MRRNLKPFLSQIIIACSCVRLDQPSTRAMPGLCGCLQTAAVASSSGQGLLLTLETWKGWQCLPVALW